MASQYFSFTLSIELEQTISQNRQTAFSSDYNRRKQVKKKSRCFVIYFPLEWSRRANGSGFKQTRQPASSSDFQKTETQRLIKTGCKQTDVCIFRFIGKKEKKR